MNKVILMGRVVRDPDVRYTQGEHSMAVARFSLAVPRRSKKENGPDCDFINCVAFDRIACFIEKYCMKGTKLVVEGHWQTGSYTNKDGSKVYTNDCMIDSCEFVESKKAAEDNNTAKPQPAANSTMDGFMNIPDGIEDEGLPFN